MTNPQKPAKRTKTTKPKGPMKKRAPQSPQEAGNAIEGISPIAPKPKQKQLGKSKDAIKRRARVMAKAVLAGKTETQAALEAGYSPASAQNVGAILENPLVKQTYCQILDAAGATDEACAKVIVDAMKAVRTVSCISGKDANAGTVDFVDVDDHPTRLKAVDMIHKVRARYVEKKVITGPDGGPILVKATELTDAELFIIASRGRTGTPASKKSSR